MPSNSKRHYLSSSWPPQLLLLLLLGFASVTCDAKQIASPGPPAPVGIGTRLAGVAAEADTTSKPAAGLYPPFHQPKQHATEVGNSVKDDADRTLLIRSGTSSAAVMGTSGGGGGGNNNPGVEGNRSNVTLALLQLAFPGGTGSQGAALSAAWAACAGVSSWADLAVMPAGVASEDCVRLGSG